MEDLFKRGQADKEAAQSFVDKWKDKLSKIPDGSGEKQHDEEFWNDLIEAFGKSRDLLDFQHKTAGNGYADVVSQELGFIAEQKSKNDPLDKDNSRQGEEVTPFQQAFRYRAGLTSDYSIRTIVTSNFETFRFYDLMTEDGLKENPCAEVALEEIPNNLNLFKSLFGGEEVRKQFGILNPEYTEMAAKEVAHLYEALKEDVDNPRFSEAKKKEFEEKIPLIVMRIVFLLFADNTSADVGKIFSSNQFTTFLEKSTDAAHFNQDLMMLFRCLNIESEEERVDELIPEELMDFPYVDGGLFEEPVKFPAISEETFGEIRDLERKFKQWDEINISVFGPIMGDAFSPEEKRGEGIHYTSKENIQKIINPLFMDELRAEFKEIKGIRGHEEKEEKLKFFHEKISRLQFFDPACGSGNFLTETYMELRDLEDEVIALENNVHDLDKDVKVSLSQFRGIEIEEYGAIVARTALQIAREQALERSYERFKDSVSAPHFLPLKDEVGGIICGNALTIDWSDLVTPSKDLFVFGNPPFVGDHNKCANQKEDLKRVFKDNYFGKLDYCTAWYYKTAHFLNKSGANFAFVSTNSITEGVQVEPLFKPIFALGWRIFFAYPSFEWPRGEATVAVVIIGLTQDRDAGIADVKENTDLIEIGGNWEGERVKTITPYLVPNLPFDGFIHKETDFPISKLPQCHKGSEPTPVSGFILQNEMERAEAEKDPIAKQYIRTYMGGRELIHGVKRWCLWLIDSTPAERNDSKFLKKRLSIVRSARRGTAKADKPVWLFAGIQQPDCDYLAIPEVFDEDREYFTAGYLSKEVIASNKLYVVEDPEGFAFSVVESLMFKVWQDLAGGRMREDNDFDKTLVYNTFPLPKLSRVQKDLIIEGGMKILEARNSQPDSTLADLYYPGNMPPELIKAHRELDKAIDLVFSSKRLRGVQERREVLLKAYEKMTGEEGK